MFLAALISRSQKIALHQLFGQRKMFRVTLSTTFLLASFGLRNFRISSTSFANFLDGCSFAQVPRCGLGSSSSCDRSRCAAMLVSRFGEVGRGGDVGPRWRHPALLGSDTSRTKNSSPRPSYEYLSMGMKDPKAKSLEQITRCLMQRRPKRELSSSIGRQRQAVDGSPTTGHSLAQAQLADGA
jgi:hypothetical protein